MDFKYFAEPVPHIIIDDFYDATALKEIWLELDFLTHSRKLMTAESTGAAFTLDEKGEKVYKKNNLGLFLDSLYANRDISNILFHTQKFYETDFLKKCQDQNFLFKYLMQSNVNFTMLSYYEEGATYETHHDKSAITILSWLYKEPKQFTGGDLTFSDYNYTIPIKNNRVLIFPGVTEHAVDPVKMNDGVKPMAGFGRYVITNFAMFRY
ncbi:MAG: 2OG-Fe(II) oxygenase [bacterium]